jgi:two-component system sensor histidine kinase KdpD
MYDFSRALLLGDDERSLATQIVQEISELFRVPDVWFYNRVMDTVSRSSAEASQLSEPLLRKVAETDTPWHDEERNASVVPVSLGGRSLASLGVAGAAGVSEVGLRAIAHLAAIAMERARARELESSAEATRQSEQLKSTLLDALAHEFKTPLTSIKAAASAMLSRQHLNEVDGEFVTVIDEESNRLSQLVTDAIELARIGSQPVHLRRGRCDAGEMVSSVLDQLRGFSAGRDIDVHVATNVPSMEADRRLIELALRQLVSNAVRYSPAGSPIRIGVTAEDEAILFQVSNEGAGIPKAEQHLVFEKFYRGREMRGRIPGTGLGLSIAREIAEAHGGRLWLESEPGHGARFLFTLPALTLRTGTLQGEQQAAR